VTIEECEHELACRKCGVSVGEIGLAAAEREDEEMNAALDEANEEIAAQLVTSVRVERYGVHEGVTVWLRGMNVGALTVGDDDGARLRRLLLSEDIVARARELVRLWKSQDGFNASVVDDLAIAVDTADRLARRTREGES
jgi:hypothetical protein